MLPLSENVASDSVFNRLVLFWAECDEATFRACLWGSEKKKEKKTEGKTSKTHIESDWKFEKKKKTPFETNVVWRCWRPGPSNSLSRANGSVDNLLLHRRWDRFTLAAYWNCNLAVSMTIGMERLHGNSQSHRTTWRTGINSHNTPPVWELEIRAKTEITIYFWEDSLKFELRDSNTVKMGLQSSIPKFRYHCSGGLCIDVTLLLECY